MPSHFRAGQATPIPEVARIIKIPVERWPGNCYAVSCAIVQARLIEGSPVYGLYHGPIAEGTMFAGRPFARHGWILTPAKSVCDPTRWVFEGVAPYMWHGPIGHEYDEGAQALATYFHRPPPPIDSAKAEVDLDLPWRVRFSLNGILGYITPAERHRYTVMQVFWLANCPYGKLEEQGGAFEVYEALSKAGYPESVPMDNRTRAERERGRRLPR